MDALNTSTSPFQGEIAIDNFLQHPAFSTLLSSTNDKWLLYLIDPYMTNKVSSSWWLTVVQLFGSDQLQRNINDVFSLAGWGGWIQKSGAIKILKIRGKTGSYLLVPEGKEFSFLVLVEDKVSEINIGNGSQGWRYNNRTFDTIYDTIQCIGDDFAKTELILAPLANHFGFAKYFHFEVTSVEEAEKVLNDGAEGSYIMWSSETNFLLSVIENSSPRHHTLSGSFEKGFFISGQKEAISFYDDYILINDENFKISVPLPPKNRTFNSRELVEIGWPWSGCNYKTKIPDAPSYLVREFNHKKLRTSQISLIHNDAILRSTSARLLMLDFVIMHLNKKGIQLKNFHEDLKDGFILGHLAQSLTMSTINPALSRFFLKQDDSDADSRKKIRIQVEAVFNHLTQHGFDLSVSRCSQDDIIIGNEKAIVNFVWSLTVQSMDLTIPNPEDVNSMLDWVKQKMKIYFSKYNSQEKLKIDNLTTSFKSGVVLVCLVHELCGGISADFDLEDIPSLDLVNMTTDKPRETLKFAFELASSKLGIPKILQPNGDTFDVISVVSYLSFLKQAEARNLPQRGGCNSRIPFSRAKKLKYSFPSQSQQGPSTNPKLEDVSKAKTGKSGIDDSDMKKREKTKKPKIEGNADVDADLKLEKGKRGAFSFPIFGESKTKEKVKGKSKKDDTDVESLSAKKSESKKFPKLGPTKGKPDVDASKGKGVEHDGDLKGKKIKSEEGSDVDSNIKKTKDFGADEDAAVEAKGKVKFPKFGVKGRGDTEGDLKSKKTKTPRSVDAEIASGDADDTEGKIPKEVEIDIDVRVGSWQFISPKYPKSKHGPVHDIDSDDLDIDDDKEKKQKTEIDFSVKSKKPGEVDSDGKSKKPKTPRNIDAEIDVKKSKSDVEAEAKVYSKGDVDVEVRVGSWQFISPKNCKSQHSDIVSDDIDTNGKRKKSKGNLDSISGKIKKQTEIDADFDGKKKKSKGDLDINVKSRKSGGGDAGVDVDQNVPKFNLEGEPDTDTDTDVDPNIDIDGKGKGFKFPKFGGKSKGDDSSSKSKKK